ncbi:hypothetical protein VSDG_04764 [Cytospora chrysosperma]|uniref:Aldehyde dehydrogenase domain-containing protein n=1 Tax=Cytospora chrysosperma TaxID=252740 RepID=A0A423W1U5_CYTCH|nr:hypothetical protein VSDG_04764 [Valsa sordida]
MSINMDLPFQLKDKTLFQTKCYVHGQWVDTKAQKRFDVVDPGTDKTWISCPDSEAEDVDGAVQSAQQAFEVYSQYTPRRRAELLMKWHNLIIAAREDLARLLVCETGKPLAEALGEVDYGNGFAWWFSGEAERVHGSVYHSSVAPGRRAFVIKQPIGVAAALCPWNYPIGMVMRKVGAALAAGCTMVVKPSPETPVTALCLAELATRAGFPPGALNVLTTGLENTPAVAEALCLHPLIKKVTFTGSTRVGKIVSGWCARNLKKVTLELGGNCPFIIFDDADLEQAVSQLMALKWKNAGQACISANRVFVQSGVHDKFVELLALKTKALKVGHGLEDGTTMGPVTTPRGLDKAESLHQDAVAKGAKIVLGTGKRECGQDGATGYFMKPTILTGISDDMEVARDEMFAPILGILKFDTEDEAVKRANDTSMGLASYVFTMNVDRLWRMFEKLEAGMIGLNTGNQSAPESPFGGIKESGMGKESGKDVAVNEFLIQKTGTLTLQDHY